MDFKDFPKAKNGMNTVVVFINRLGKRLISIPCYKTYMAHNLAKLYYMHVLCYFGLLDTIVSNYSL